MALALTFFGSLQVRQGGKPLSVQDLADAGEVWAQRLETELLLAEANALFR